MLCCPFQMYHIHTKTHTQRHTFSLTTPLNKFLLTSEIAILMQGYSFSLLFHINSFSLQTFPPGSLGPSTLLNRKLFFSIANSVSLPPSLTFRCHPSTSPMPDCSDRPEFQVGGIWSLRGEKLWQWGPLSNHWTQSPEPLIKKSWRLLGANRAAVSHSAVDWLPENSLCVPETTVEYAGRGWGNAS